MRRIIAIAVVVFLVGCGPSFNGTFYGVLDEVGSCSDGSGLNRSGSNTWSISEHASDAEIAMDNGCGIVMAAAAGNTGTIKGQGCAVEYVSGASINPWLVGGTMSLVSTGITVSFSRHYSISMNNGQSGTCDGTTTGNLRRK